MPPKQQPTKRTSSTSPTTSTSHPAADQHHRLRHTGPSITRGTTSSKPAATHAHAHAEHAQSEKKPLKEAQVSPPGSRASLAKFLYILLFAVLLLLGWYIHGTITLLEKMREEVGWWGIVVGDARTTTPAEREFRSDRSGGGSVQDALSALADALGVAPVEVASAVEPLVAKASASLTSGASKATETKTGERVEDTTQTARRIAHGMGRGAGEEDGTAV